MNRSWGVFWIRHAQSVSVDELQQARYDIAGVMEHRLIRAQRHVGEQNRCSVLVLGREPLRCGHGKRGRSHSASAGEGDQRSSGGLHLGSVIEEIGTYGSGLSNGLGVVAQYRPKVGGFKGVGERCLCAQFSPVSIDEAVVDDDRPGSQRRGQFQNVAAEARRGGVDQQCREWPSGFEA